MHRSQHESSVRPLVEHDSSLVALFLDGRDGFIPPAVCREKVTSVRRPQQKVLLVDSARISGGKRWEGSGCLNSSSSRAPPISGAEFLVGPIPIRHRVADPGGLEKKIKDYWSGRRLYTEK